ncbi:MAG TPA: RNA-binding domain-containing protein [Candidatus Poseidoniaceae archaeon]|jgi:RNA binding exosome subunit|nr:RNA-binding domain-containing protein [Candidatus Poseidoniaceae archaeon]
MPIHALMFSTTASGLHDIELLTASLEWLCDDRNIVYCEKTTSFHGSPITLIKIKLSRSQSRRTLSRLGGIILDSLISQIDSKLDDENRLHFRISQNELVKGKISLANDTEEVIKVIAKIEVYPGEDPKQKLLKLLNESLERCERRGWLHHHPNF